MKREQWLDSLKGLGILLVIVGHTNSPLFKLIYGFHMPLFFVISGYLYKADKEIVTTFSEYLKKRVSTYLVPYFILSGVNFFVCTIELICRNGVSENVFSTMIKWIYGVLLSYGQVEYLPNCTPLWFFVGLFIAHIFMYALIKFKRETYRVAGCVVLILLDYILSVTNHWKLPWNVDAAMIGCVCMYFGYIFKKYIEERLWHKRCVSVLSGVVGISLILINQPVAVLPNQLGNPICFWGGAILTSMSLILLFKKHNIRVSFFMWLGSNTAIVMGFNYFFRDFTRILWMHIPTIKNYGCPWWIETFVVTVMACLTICIWNYLKCNFPVLKKMRI